MDIIFSITANKQVLSKTLAHVQSIIERRNIFSIQFNVKIVAAENGSVEFTSTDNLIVVMETIECAVEHAGALTVSASMLFDIVRKLDENKDISLTITADEPTTLKIKSGRSSFKLSTLPVEQFHCIDNSNLTHHFTISSKKLKEIIDRTKIAICNEESRYNLNGVNLFYKDGLHAVTTDGHRLCFDQTNEVDRLEEFPSIIIPKKTIIEVRKIIDESDSSISFSASNSKILLAFDKIVIISKLVNASFPDCSRLIPKQNILQAKIDAKALSKAIDRATIIIDEKSKGIKFSIEKDKLTLSSSSNDGNSCVEYVEIESNIEEKLEIGFNARYLLEGLAIISGEKVLLSFKDQFSSALMEDSASDSFKYVLMPMRVN